MAWLFPAAIAIGTIISWAMSVRAAVFLVIEIVEAATPDEHEKGWLITKPKLLLSRLFTLHPPSGVTIAKILYFTHMIHL